MLRHLQSLLILLGYIELYFLDLHFHLRESFGCQDLVEAPGEELFELLRQYLENLFLLLFRINHYLQLLLS